MDDNKVTEADMRSEIKFKYLPFIQEMRAKVEGTSVELKWQMIHDSIVKPMKK